VKVEEKVEFKIVIEVSLLIMGRALLEGSRVRRAHYVSHSHLAFLTFLLLSLSQGSALLPYAWIPLSYYNA